MQKLAFRFGANVYGRSGHCGILTKIVVDPITWQVTDLIVEDGLIFKRATTLPITQVQETTGQSINLKLDCDQLLREFPEFAETFVEKAMPTSSTIQPHADPDNISLPSAHTPGLVTTTEKKRVGVATNATVLDDSTIIACLDGNIGRLSHLLLEEDFLISYLVFKLGTLFPKYYTVASCDIDSLGEALTQIRKTKAEAEQLPEFAMLSNEQSHSEGENS